MDGPTLACWQWSLTWENKQIFSSGDNEKERKKEIGSCEVVIMFGFFFARRWKLHSQLEWIWVLFSHFCMFLPSRFF